MRGRNGPWLDTWVWQEQISLCLSGIFRNPVYIPQKTPEGKARVYQHGPLLAVAISALVACAVCSRSLCVKPKPTAPLVLCSISDQSLRGKPWQRVKPSGE